jgi:hypothetical protein
MGHGILGARVVPHNCFTKRLSSLLTPYDGSLALIRNACTCQSRSKLKISTAAQGRASHVIKRSVGINLTKNFDAFLCPASGFQGLCALFNTEVRMLLNFISVMLVPSGSTAMRLAPRVNSL